MSRRAAREDAFKLLFQLEFQKDDVEEQVRLFLEETDIDEKEMEYISKTVNGTSNEVEKIDNLVEKHLKGWTLKRISKVDLSILRLAVFEILQCEDIPYNVSINEAVELAKKYSGEESAAFINGVLGQIVKEKV